MTKQKPTPVAPTPARRTTADDADHALAPAIPFKPRRKLFIFLCLAFALWVGALLAMYFVTVYPYRGQQRYFIPGGTVAAEK